MSKMMSISKITQQADAGGRRSEPCTRAAAMTGALCPRAPPSSPGCSLKRPRLRGLRAALTLQSWKCSDWSVSWISGSRVPGGCCCGCCCEADDEPAVRPSSTFLMLNFLMVSTGRPRGPGGEARGDPGRGPAPGPRAAPTRATRGGAGERGSRRGRGRLGRSTAQSRQETLRRRQRRPLLLRGRRGSPRLLWRRSGRRRLAPRPGSPAEAAAPEPAPPSLTWPRAAAAPRRRPGSPPPRPWPAARPPPAVPGRSLPLRLLLRAGSPALGPPPLGLAAAQRRCPPGIARVGPRACRLAPPRPARLASRLPSPPLPAARPGPNARPGSRGYSVGRGAGGSWASTEPGCRACACAPHSPLPRPPPPAPSRERSSGLNYPLRKAQIGAKFLPPHSPRQRLQLLLLQPGGENVAG